LVRKRLIKTPLKFGKLNPVKMNRCIIHTSAKSYNSMMNLSVYTPCECKRQLTRCPFAQAHTGIGLTLTVGWLWDCFQTVANFWVDSVRAGTIEAFEDSTDAV
jgi:hypothetical protein